MSRQHRRIGAPHSAFRASHATKGIVYLVGAGPGDPRLLTLRGQELLGRAGVVVYDHLVAPRMLAACPRGAKLVYVGKEANAHTATQASINRLLVREATLGKVVVRLKGGDPFLFGRGGEEALELAKEHIPYEIVPGVTSAIAVPAYAGIPVTHRGLSSSVAIVTGHEGDTNTRRAIHWDKLATSCDTLVFLMGVRTLGTIVGELKAHGRSVGTPCALIEWGTRPQQRTVVGSLKTIAARARRAGIRPPTVLVVGDVVSLRSRVNWFESKPLFGRRILVTRASDKSGALSAQLEALGAAVEELPAIELAPVRQDGTLQRLVGQTPKADWVFFTSPEGIRWLARMLKPHRRDVRWLEGCHIGAIGPKTAAAIEEAGVHVDFVPKRFSQEGIVAGLPSRLLAGKRALIFSAEESRDVLAQGLRSRGMSVTKIPVYRTTIPGALVRNIAALVREPFDFVSVTSASCVEHVFEALRGTGRARVFRTLRFASIGPVTSAAVRAHGGHVAVQASVSTIEGLVDALIHRRGAHQ